MKILHIIAGADVGGAETFFIDAVEALAETACQQRVVTRFNNQHKIDIIKKHNIPLEKASFSNLWPFPTSRKINKQIKDFKPDIVHHWMGRAGSFSQIGDHVNLGWYGGYYKPERFKHCTHHAGVSRDIVRHIKEQGIAEQNAHLLHIYAEFEKGTPLNRADFETPEDAPLLLALARLHVKKGLDVLLKSLIDVPEAYLWIAGSGPLEKELKGQMKELGLENRVRFLGWRTDRENLLATCDICVFPSRYEPFGAVVIEAWAMGKPLIAAKSQGPKAYVTHEEDGLLVEIDDVIGLGDAIKRILADKPLAEKMIKNGLQSYKNGFTREVFKNNILQLYEKILKK